tara:strand:- start:1852 stop:2706 length:855 start_codon:yes stop_codon:yes gene_type:complete
MYYTIKSLLDSHSKNLISLNKKDVEVCLCHIINKTRTFIHLNPEYEITKSQYKQFQGFVKLLKNGQPLAYVIGNEEFYGYEYFINNDVLIPRSETEIIIPEILKYGDKIFEDNKKLTIIDAGSGSGCIGLTIASERPNWNIILIEKSLKSIDLLKKNHDYYLHKNCTIIATDWLKGINQNIADIIVSNPPYIDFGSKYVDKNVYKFEPHHALFSENKGLSDIKTLVSQARFILNENGLLFLENGFDQSDKIMDILKENYYEDIDIILDYNGIKRFTISRSSYYG